MFLGPVLKNRLEVRTDLIGLFHHILGLLIEIKLNTVTDDHQIQNETLVLGLIVRATHDVLDQLQVVSDKLFLDVPVGLLDHVGQKNDLDFVQEEYFTDGFQDLENRVFGPVLARFRDAIQEGVDPFHVVFCVHAEDLCVF